MNLINIIFANKITAIYIAKVKNLRVSETIANTSVEIWGQYIL